MNVIRSYIFELLMNIRWRTGPDYRPQPVTSNRKENANNSQRWPLEWLVEENTKAKHQARCLICRPTATHRKKLREIYNLMLRSPQPSALSLNSRLQLMLRLIYSFAFLKTHLKHMRALQICIPGCLESKHTTVFISSLISSSGKKHWTDVTCSCEHRFTMMIKIQVSQMITIMYRKLHPHYIHNDVWSNIWSKMTVAASQSESVYQGVPFLFSDKLDT